MIGEGEAELGVVAQVAVRLGGFDVGVEPVGVDVRAEQVHARLGVPADELESGAVDATLANRVPVAVRPVDVANEEVDHQVIDVVVDIEVVFVGRVVGAVGVVAL